MQATKAILLVVVLGAIVATGVFYFFPNTRPAIVEKWFNRAQGITPAESPRDAIEKFRDRIAKRDYKNSVLYLTGDYKEEMRIAAEPATELGKAIDDVQHAMKEYKVDSDKTQFVLGVLDPFPTDIVIKDVHHKEGEDHATATLEVRVSSKPMTDPRGWEVAQWKIDPNMLIALYPVPWNGVVNLKQEGEGKEKGWKIEFPVSEILRTKAGTLKKNSGNYVRALTQFKNEIKNDPSTKSATEQQLKKLLEESK
jgi:hypothetical protein